MFLIAKDASVGRFGFSCMICRDNSFIDSATALNSESSLAAASSTTVLVVAFK